MKRLFYLLVVLSLVSCAEKRQKKNEVKIPVKVGVMTITSSESLNAKVYIGEVDAIGSTVVSSSHIGVLSSINVKQGSKVKAGDVVAEVISKNVQATYEMSQATLRQAEDGYERVKKVHETGTIPDVKFIEIETQVAKARAAAKASEQSLEECRIKAPFDGIVSSIVAEQGISVNPGTAILMIVDVSTIEIDIPVPEGEISNLKVGQPAFVDVPALGLENIEAKVKSKGIIADFLSHTYICNVAPVKKVPELLPGMVCKVRVPDLESSNSIIIPSSSVEVDASGKYVWVVKNGKVGKKYITVNGYQDKGIVVSSGLEIGDSVIINGAAKVSTGMSVETVEQSI